MKKLFALILVVCMSLFIYACGGEKIVVEFETNGGSEIAKVEVADALSFKLPANPTKEGYEFKGWYLDAEFTKEFKTLGSESIKLYAKWEEKLAHTHEFGEWVIVKEATETEEGLKEKTCSCGEKETEVIEKLEHVHAFGEWVVVKEATETEEGLKEKTCSCGEKETEVIEKLEHVHNFVNGECSCGEKEEHVHNFVDGKCECGAEEEVIVKYTVTFKGKDGEVLATVEVEEGQAAEAPAAPDVEGFEFKGWNVDFTSVNADLEVLAIYEEVVLEEPGIEIVLPNGQTEFYLDDTFTLTAIVKPSSSSQEVTWRAMNRTKATISESGKVTILAEGEATFRATSVADGTLKASVTINIIGYYNPYAIMEKLAVDTVVLQKTRAWDSTAGYITTLYGGIANYLFEDIEVKDKFIPVGNGNRPGTKSNGNLFSARYVTVHGVGGAGNAASTANYAVGSSTTVSWHYTTGNDGIYQHLPLNEVGYHAGDGTTVPLEFYNSGIKAPDGDKTPGKITINQSTGYFQVNGVDSEVLAPKNSGRIISNSSLPYTGINNYVNEDGYYMIGNTYWNSTYATLSNRGGNLNSIGIETCVNKGSNIYLTWHYTAKLIATVILPSTGLTTYDVKQHNTFSGKDCPQTMRHANRWESFMDIVNFEYEIASKFLMRGWKLELICDSPYIGTNGILETLPETTTELTYQVRLSSTRENFDETFTYTVKVPGADTIA